MSVTSMSSREFNQDTGGAKRAAGAGPVYITDRGHPSHVLLTFEHYERLASPAKSMVELLSSPEGVEHVEFDLPQADEPARPARLD